MPGKDWIDRQKVFIKKLAEKAERAEKYVKALVEEFGYAALASGKYRAEFDEFDEVAEDFGYKVAGHEKFRLDVPNVQMLVGRIPDMTREDLLNRMKEQGLIDFNFLPTQDRDKYITPKGREKGVVSWIHPYTGKWTYYFEKVETVDELVDE